MTKYSAIPRPCRHHGYQRHHANTKCFFCYRRFLLSRYYHRKEIPPEEILLRQIFGEGGRYFISHPSKKKRLQRRHPKVIVNPPTGLGKSSLIASWTDGSKL